MARRTGLDYRIMERFRRLNPDVVLANIESAAKAMLANDPRPKERDALEDIIFRICQARESMAGAGQNPRNLAVNLLAMAGAMLTVNLAPYHRGRSRGTYGPLKTALLSYIIAGRTPAQIFAAFTANATIDPDGNIEWSEIEDAVSAKTIRNAISELSKKS